MSRKSFVLILGFFVAGFSSVSATFLLSPAYSITSLDDADGLLLNSDKTFHSIGLQMTFLQKSGLGFYMQINPFIAIYARDKNNEYTGDGSFYIPLPSEEEPKDYLGLSVYLDSLIGFGYNFDWNKFGLILGGGLYIKAISFAVIDYSNIRMVPDRNGDLNYEADERVFSGPIVTFGLGFGANGYFKPGDGNFVLHFGFMFGWNPVTVTGDESNNNEIVTVMAWEQVSATFSLGIGWVQKPKIKG